MRHARSEPSVPQRSRAICAPRRSGGAASERKIATLGRIESVTDTPEALLAEIGEPDQNAVDVGMAELERRLFGGPREAPALGRYELLELHAEGGMGIIFRGYDPKLDRTVAIKLVRAELDGLVPADELEAEGRAVARVQHPNVISVHDIGRYEREDFAAHPAWRHSVPEHGAFVVMPWIDGDALDRWNELRQPSLLELLRVFRGAGEGLCAVHDAGLVHADFKPSNVIISSTGRPCVLDFGLATGVSYSEGLKTSAVRGTPRYMSPEQHRGGAITAASDQFSFCVALWDSVVGEPPFGRGDSAELADAKRRGEIVVPAAGSRAPRWLVSVLRRGMQSDPADRYPSMRSLLGALDIRRRQRRRLGLAAAGTAVALVGVAAIFQPSVDNCDALARETLAWDEGRRGALQHELSALPLPSAREQASQTVGRLDAFAEAWVRERAAACDRAFDRGAAQSQAPVLCLQRAQTTFEAITDALEAGGEATARRAADLLVELPDPGRCAEQRNASGAVLLPAQSDARALAEEAVALLERSRIEFARAHPVKQLALAQSAHAKALIVDHPPLLLVTTRQLARSLWANHRPGPAAERAEEALQIAERLGDDEAALRLQIDLIGILSELGSLDEAMGLARATRTRALGVGAAPAVRAEFHSHFGELQARRQKPDAALAELDEALRLRESEGQQGRAQTRDLELRAGILLELKRLPEAEAAYLRTCEIHARVAGPSHPATSACFVNLGNVALERGNLAGAREHYAHALALFDDDPEAAPSHVAATLTNLGAVDALEGELTLARANLERALEIRRGSVGASHPSSATTRYNLAEVDGMGGRHEQARSNYGQAKALWTQSLGGDHPQLAAPEVGLAEVSLAKGNFEEAERWAAEALERLDGSPIPMGDVRGRAHWVRAQLWLAERPSDAIEEAKRAKDVLETFLLPVPQASGLIPWLAEHGGSSMTR